MKNGSSPTLTKNWMYTHKPAPGSERPYYPNRSHADVHERPGDLCGLGGEFDTGVMLRAIGRATKREQDKLENSMR